MNPISAPLSLTVLGGDMRQNYLANYLSEKGHSVTCFCPPAYSLLKPDIRQAASLAEALSASKFIIGPVPFTRDQKTINGSPADMILLSNLYTLLNKNHFLIGGNLPASAHDVCDNKRITCYDFMQSESLIFMNAELTAEGMIGELLQKTPFMLQSCPILIIGYGRCGTVLAQKLHAIGSKICVCDISETRRAMASSLGFKSFPPSHLKDSLSLLSVIINTVPELVLSEDCLACLSPSCLLFDLATPPGGIDQKAAIKHNLPVFQCLGLPGKTAPLSAGEAIGITILERIAAND